ncbi:MAG: hypothetical protein ACYCT0_06610 [Sulfobacillus sp.]
MVKATHLSLAALATLALAGCGASAAPTASQSSSPKPSPSASSTMTSSTTPASTTSQSATAPEVYSIEANKTAQMVQAGQEATFTITAATSSGQPAADQAVTFYIGPMVPLSGNPPKAWYQSGTTTGSNYIASYSKTTNSQGQATLVLRGQPTKSMEMVGISVGDLSSYVAGKGALGSMDAWWTTSSTMPSGPVGDYVTVSPFITRVSSASSSPQLAVMAGSPTGAISNASVDFIPKPTSMGAGMSSSGGMMATTGSTGKAAYSVMMPSQGMLPIRIVVTQGSAMTRVAGGMNALFVGP